MLLLQLLQHTWLPQAAGSAAAADGGAAGVWLRAAPNTSLATLPVGYYGAQPHRPAENIDMLNLANAGGWPGVAGVLPALPPTS